jgi:hypothetical protein
VPDYNVNEDDRNPNRHAIGLLATAKNVPKDGLGQSSADNLIDAWVEACREVPAPGPSLNKVSTTASANADHGLPKRTEVRDCQWWIKQVVTHLVGMGVLLPLDNGSEEDSPERLVDRLPQH